MSSQPHIVLPWVVRRTRLPLLSLRCVDCRSESATTGEGRFRVNANGKLLDVWLLVRCVYCDRTSKLTVHERAPVRSFDPELHLPQTMRKQEERKALPISYRPTDFRM